MKKFVSLFLVLVFVTGVSFAEIDFVQMHSTLEQIERVAKKMRRISKIYQKGNWTINTPSGNYSTPFTTEVKQQLKTDWLNAKNKLQNLINTLPGQ